MNIEKRRFNKLINSANILLIIAIIIYAITAFAFFGILFLQNVFIKNEFNPGFFIFPVYQVIGFLFGFISVIIFAILVIKKNLKNNKSIGLELFALITVILIHTLIARIMLTLSKKVLVEIMPIYPARYYLVNYYLSLTTSLVPYALLLFYVGVAIKMVLTKLNLVEIE